MKDIFNRYKKEIITITIILLLFAFFIPILFNLPYPFGYIESDNDWIGFWGSFAGSIIGGVVTLIGVILSINHNSEMMKKQQEEQYKPILDIQSQLFSNEEDNQFVYTCVNSNYMNRCLKQMNSSCLYCEFDDKENYCYRNRTYAELVIVNKGRGVAKNIRTDSQDIRNGKYGFLLSVDEKFQLTIEYKLPPPALSNFEFGNFVSQQIIYEDLSGNRYSCNLRFTVHTLKNTNSNRRGINISSSGDIKDYSYLLTLHSITHS